MQRDEAGNESRAITLNAVDAQNVQICVNVIAVGYSYAKDLLFDVNTFYLLLQLTLKHLEFFDQVLRFRNLNLLYQTRDKL